MLSSISSRMLQLIERKLPKYGRFQELERLTHIKNATWQTWARGRQRPTEQMIEAVASTWPAHAYWLVTGDELPLEGMTDPRKEYSREMQTLAEFTAKSLSMRLAIRDELFATSKLTAIDDGKGEINVEHMVDIFQKLGERMHELDINVQSLPEEEQADAARQAFERLLAEMLASDHQLNTLESTRHRLIVQVLEKGEVKK